MKHHVTIAPYLKDLCERLERGEIKLAGYAGGRVGSKVTFSGPIDDLHQLYNVFMIPAAVRGEIHKGILTRTVGAGMTTDAVRVYTDHAVELFVLSYAEKSPLS